MKTPSKPLKIRHAQDVYNQLKSESGLPFSQILPAEQIDAAVAKQSAKLKMRKRFFFESADSVDLFIASLERRPVLSGCFSSADCLFGKLREKDTVSQYRSLQ